MLFVFIVLSHERRRVIHFNITEHPTAAWTAQQIIEAFPEDQVPRYLVRDRDGIYGEYFQHRVQGMGIREVRTAPRSPWQNPYVERVIGTFVMHNKSSVLLGSPLCGVEPELPISFSSAWSVHNINWFGLLIVGMVIASPIWDVENV